MGQQTTAPLDDTASPSLAALAAQLRDGPLQDLLALHLKANALADRLAASPADRLEDLEGLLRLSLSAMAQFHSFTREFAAVLRELSDARRPPH